MTIIQGIILGLSTAGATGLYFWINAKSNRLESIQENQSKTLLSLATIQDDIRKGELELKKNLTSPDLLEVACSKEYLEQNGDLLCREMFCRLQTREGDGAAQSECEEISNVSNSLYVLGNCKKLELEIETCLEYVGKRK